MKKWAFCSVYLQTDKNWPTDVTPVVEEAAGEQRLHKNTCWSAAELSGLFIYPYVDTDLAGLNGYMSVLHPRRVEGKNSKRNE